MTTKQKKKQKLRNNEYYDTQKIFDDLYNKSKNGKIFKNLLQLITNKQNILLAYRNIKKNKGSKTKGTNNTTIIDVGRENPERLIEYVRKRLENFKPHSVRRVEIEKENGKMRPLGIPTLEDRLIQQCIKQILEPICEAKFYKHSYGFRPNRSTHHAIARAMYLIHQSQQYYVVDIDIKGFFDNVSHSKLLKQIWSMGIQDKNLICILSKMLKAEILGIGISTKGVPQGGILSPLLSNIVLNEFDWWISSQWENMKTRHTFVGKKAKDGSIQPWHKHRALRESKLKECYVVRYADDFKIFCKNKEIADRIFIATKNWLKERLQLEISEEKSRITNLKTQYSEFLGIRIKVHKKDNKWAVQSSMTDKSIKKAIGKIKTRIKKVQKYGTYKEVGNLNATILGLHNYYKCATHIYGNFDKIACLVKRTLYNRTKSRRNKTGTLSEAYKKFYAGYTGKKIFIANTAIYPISYLKTSPPKCFSQEICNYTEQGRKIIHEKLKGVNQFILQYLLQNPITGYSTEYNDNRISLYVGQCGICGVSKQQLKIGEMDTHHKTPKFKGGTDVYENLIFVTTDVHRLIHATNKETIKDIRARVNLDKTAVGKINKLRALVGNCKI